MHYPRISVSHAEATSESYMRFARGFLLSHSASPKFPTHWHSVSIDESWSLSWDPRVELSIASGPAGTLCLLGVACDPQSPTLSHEVLTSRLLAEWGHHEDSFQDHADRLVGRFVLLRISSTTALVQNDATGLRTVFFSTDRARPTCASHARLVDLSIEAGPSIVGHDSFFTDSGMRYYPGRLTQHQNVLQLTPNTEVDVLSAATRRIFPRKDVSPITLSQGIDLYLENTSAQGSFLSQWRGQLLSSLSAGVDSRSTLACLKSASDSIRFFTYDIVNAKRTVHNKFDLNTAKELADTYNLHHETIEITSSEIPQGLNRSLMANTRRPHSKALAGAYLERLPLDGLHIRSNSNGVVKKPSQGLGKTLPARDFAGKELLGVVNSKVTDALSVEGFDEFVSATDFPRSGQFDPMDLLFWEYRLGVERSSVYLEQDVAHEAYSLINSRALIGSLLTIPADDLASGNLFVETIRRAWPELLSLPINGKMRV